jgi:hypothetical protein
MRLRVAWAVALALAVSVVVGVIVVVVGRSDTVPSTPVPKAAPRSVANLTCGRPPPARTPAGDRAGFSEGAVLGGRQGAILEAELAGIAATGARYLRIDVDWSASNRHREHTIGRRSIGSLTRLGRVGST